MLQFYYKNGREAYDLTMNKRQVIRIRQLLKRSVLFALGVMTCAMFYATRISATASIAITPTTGGTVSNNHNTQEYNGSWATRSNSYLVAKGTGYYRIEGIGNNVIVEEYSSDFSLESTKSIANELSQFGGFFEGENAYFLIYGENNDFEENGTEVLRVVKYDKEWTRQGSASYSSLCTYKPFEKGSLAVAEYGNILYVRTCHETYLSNDNRPQTNLTISINEDTMTIVASADRTNLSETNGYFKPTYNQFAKIINGKLVTIDHSASATSSKRGVMLGAFSSDASTGSLSTGFSYKNILQANASSNGDYTAINIGAFEISAQNYLVAYNLEEFDSDANKYVKSVKLLVKPQSSALTTSDVTIKDIQTYSAGNYSAGNPYMIPIGNDQFAIIWEEQGCRASLTQKPVVRNRLRIATVDGTGKKLSNKTQLISGSCLSDCKPIYANGKVVWYVTKNGSPIFYSIPLGTQSHVMVHHEAVAATCENAGSLEYWECTDCKKLFSDEEGKNEVTATSLVVNATGHDWNEATYEWSDDLSEVTATRICINDESHVESEKVITSYQVVTPATCTKIGKGRYEAEFQNADFASQYLETDIPIDETAHEFGEWTIVTPATIYEKGVERRTCVHDATHYEERTIPRLESNLHFHDKECMTYHEAKAPTCTEAGNNAYYECECGMIFTEDGESFWYLPPLGHDLEYHEEIIATQEHEGVQEYWECLECGKLFSDPTTEIESIVITIFEGEQQ